MGMSATIRGQLLRRPMYISTFTEFLNSVYAIKSTLRGCAG